MKKPPILVLCMGKNKRILHVLWKIYLKEQTATSINGITFKLAEMKSGEYEGV
jgi:hypothetical protein